MSSMTSTHCGEPSRAWTPTWTQWWWEPSGYRGMSCEPVRMAIWFMDGLRLALASELWLREPGFPL